VTVQNPATHVKENTQPFTGLTPAEVERSRQQYGSNVLTPPKRDPWWKLYLEKFEDPIIRILIIAAVITLIVGVIDNQYAEGIGIILAIFLATTLAFVNEYRAKQEFDILNQVNNEVPIRVIRDGIFTTVPRKDLVVGDLVLVEVGDEVPADGRILEAVSLQANESLLTGEPLPVNKMVSNSHASGGETFPLDKLFRGTMIVDGHGVAEMTAVGDSTEIGKIAREASEETEEITPLNAQLERLSKLIGVIGFGVAGLTYIALVSHAAAIGELVLTSQEWLFAAILTVSVLIALSRVWMPTLYDAFELAGRERKPPKWLENGGLGGWLLTFGAGLAVFGVATLIGILLGTLSSSPSEWLPVAVVTTLLRFFMIAVTIIVVAVPEGLPMSVTLSLAYSMRKMTATNNLVRRMHACETIGAATVICSDKTGTLTMNQMRVNTALFPSLDGKPISRSLDSTAAQLIVEGMAANTTAHLSRIPGEPLRVVGDSTEGALLLWLEDKGFDYVLERANFKTKYQLIFSAERKYMGTLGTSAVTGVDVLYVKGAPEILLDRCVQVMTATGLEPLDAHRAVIETELQAFQRRGMRALGFAYQTIAYAHEDVDALVTELIWLGFVAIADPIRPEVPDAIRACRDAGIKVKVVTGDNPETAQEIARQIGLWDRDDDTGHDRHLIGVDFAALPDEQAEAIAPGMKVLSRARPGDKMRLVRLLQDKGQVVAVTGDGTNDAPALNYANVGLAMGSGTDIAKEASDIILLDDSFGSIVNAVMWGRSLYQNIQRFILFQLTINVAALGIALLGPFIGVEFPLTVIQMLWVNLIMDTFASLALATEPPHWDVMKSPPRKSTDFIISPPMGKTILGVGGLFIVALIAFLLYIQGEGGVTRYELSIFYTGFVLLQVWNLFNARAMGRKQSAFSNVLENRGFVGIVAAIIVGQFLITQFGGSVFRTVPLSLRDWILVILVTSLVLWVGEIWRWMGRRQQSKPV
jgi:P-type Ca2+ transporter type 2C